MIGRNTRAAGVFLLALAIVAPGCTFSVTSAGGGLPIAVAASTGNLNETETIPPRRVEVGDDSAIVVDNRVGRVAVAAGEAGVVVVEAVKRAATKDDLGRIKLGVEKAGNTVTIKWDVDPQAMPQGALDLTIKAPAGSSLRLRTGNGAIAAEGFRRGAEAHTGVGSITVKDVPGDLALEAGNGAIEAEGTDGTVSAKTGVGAIAVKASRGSLTLHAGNGSITLDGASGPVSARADLGRIETQHTKGDLTLKTGNGAIRAGDADGRFVAETGMGAVDVSGRLAGRCQITTGNGAINVALPAQSNLAVDAATGNGSISNAFGLPVSGRVSRKSSGTIGDGSGGSLHLKTGVGAIHVKAQ